MRRVFLVLMISFFSFAVYAQSGTIREFSGDVQVQAAGASDFSPAQQGQALAQDAVVSTGFRSSAIIVIGSSEITVRPLTRLTLAEISSSAESEKLNVNLQTGRVRVDVKPPAGARAAVNVQSPSATASVRGTSFEMDTRNLSVTEGSVKWSDSNGFSASVTVGFSSAIGVTGSIVDPVEVAQAELAVTAPAGSGEAGETSGASASIESADIDVGVGVRW